MGHKRFRRVHLGLAVAMVGLAGVSVIVATGEDAPRASSPKVETAAPALPIPSTSTAGGAAPSTSGPAAGAAESPPGSAPAATTAKGPSAARPSAPAPVRTQAPSPVAGPVGSASRVVVDHPSAAPLSAPAGVPPGSYTLTAVLRGAAARAQLTVAGQRVAEVAVDGSARSLAVPVWIDGATQSVGVVAVAHPESDTAGPVAVDSLRLDPASPRMTTRGTAILDASGRRFMPRGVTHFSLSSDRSGYHFHEPDVAGMHRWGVEIVRVMLGQQFWVKGMCEYDPSYLTRVDERVRWITDRGMVALLSLTRATRGDPCGDYAHLQRAPDQFSPQFWREVADRYKANPLVAYDLFNEPHHIPGEVWRDGGAIEEEAETVLGGERVIHRWDAVGMQPLYDIVRGTGATNLVFVSGITWAFDPRSHLTHPLDGWGIVAAVHAYCLECGGQQPPKLDRNVEPVAEKLPIVLTEFGWVEDSSTYNANLIRWAESRRFGWVAHAWAATAPQDFGLLLDWDTHQPSRQGQPVYDALQRPA